MFDYIKMIKEKYSIDLKRNIFIVGSPSHGNLGDQAIWYATKQILRKVFTDANIIDILIEDFSTDIDAIYQLIKEEDIIILQGGGNLGNYYMDDEMIRRYVIGRFHNNRIILFPQSVDFSEDVLGKQEFAKSKIIYENNKNLVLLARDRASYAFLKQNMSLPVYELPDVVLTLNLCSEEDSRNGALLCLRDDRESARSEQEKEKIESFLRNRFQTVKKTDTISSPFEWKRDREKRVFEKIREFRKAELVVTDRLHGMIFAAITGTPCIVLPNCNTKVECEYEYLNKLNYLALIRSIDGLEDAYVDIMNTEQIYFDEQPYEKKFVEFLSKYIVDVLDNSQADLFVSGIMEAGSYWDKNICETKYWFDKLKSDYEKSNEEKNTLQKMIDDYQKKYVELEKWQIELSANYHKTVEGNQLLNEVVDECQSKYNLLEQWHTRLKIDYEKSNEEKEELQKVVNEFQAKYKQLEQWHTQLKIDYEKSSEEKNGLQKLVHDYQIKYTELEKWHEQLKVSYKELQEMQ